MLEGTAKTVVAVEVEVFGFIIPTADEEEDEEE